MTTTIELKRRRGQVYTCAGKGGRYELLGSSIGAGERRGELLAAYRNLDSGQVYHRSLADFALRMRLLGDEPAHLNGPDALPPVDCPLLILVDGRLIPAERTGFIERRDRAMTYRTAAGEIVGRFYWTYP